MANKREASHLSLPAMKSEERSESAESIYKSERRSSIPLPTGRPNSAPIFPRPSPQPGPTEPSPVQPGLTQPLPRPKSFPSPTYHRFLTPAEWARVAHGVGAIKENETHTVVHPTCWYWPPKGMPEGLYRDVVTQRSQYCFSYHLMSGLRWFLMILQIILGATLTALGSVQLREGVSITVLAALNTVDAGLLALMHNTGLPDRYRLDKVEYCKVEDFLKVFSLSVIRP